jgi:hypothetical protein
MPKRTKKPRPKRSSRRQTRRRSQPNFVDDVRARLATGVPAELLVVVSDLLVDADAADRRPDPPATFDDLVASLFTSPMVETSALLLAVAILRGNADLLRRARLEIAARGDVLPHWLVELDSSVPVGRAVAVARGVADVEYVLVGVEVPGGGHLTVAARVDLDLGCLLSDALVIGEPLPAAEQLLADEAADDPDAVVTVLSPDDARARIEYAITEADTLLVPLETEQWPANRALVEWILEQLPEGGEPYDVRDLDDEELDRLTEEFLASDDGTAWRAAEFRELVDEVVAHGSGSGDPLTWGSTKVWRVMTGSLAVSTVRVPHAERGPDVLRDLIRYGHALRRLRPGLTDEVLTLIDDLESTFRDVLAARREELGEP